MTSLPPSQVARVSPQKFWEFHLALMDGQEDFYDIPSSKRTPTETRAKLIDLALPIIGSDKKEVLTDLLTHKTSPNGGTAVTDELKYTSTFDPRLSVIEVLLTSHSQVLPSEFDPCLPHCPLGWTRRKRHFQQLGRKGVDLLLGIQGSRLGKIMKLSTRVYLSVCTKHKLTWS